MQKRRRDRKRPNVFFLPFQNTALFYLAEQRKIVSYLTCDSNTDEPKPRKSLRSRFKRTGKAPEECEAGDSGHKE